MTAETAQVGAASDRLEDTTDMHVLVAGASGLVGHAAIQQFRDVLGVKVTALSRRPPPDDHGARFLSLDLTDANACAAAAASLGDVTHVVYAALYEKPELIDGWRDAEQIAVNAAMLRNLMLPLAKAAPGLRHITLLQGAKAYGAHVRRMNLPPREDRDEAHDIANFYWEQENWLRAACERHGWGWTIWRPQIIFGLSFGSAMNPITTIGAWAALLRERGEPLYFPGGLSGNVLQAVDADLLARAIAWGATSANARDSIFNITNGDVFVWANVWPAIAAALGMAPGEHRPSSLADTLAGAGDAWEAICRRYRLSAPPLADFVGASAQYVDYLMARNASGGPKVSIISDIRRHEAGFGEVMDTEAMFRKWFAEFRAARLLPGLPG